MSKSREFIFFLRNLLLSVFVTLLIVRIYTGVSLATAPGTHTYGLLAFLQAFLEDLWLLLVLSLPLYIIGLLLYHLSPRASKITLFLIATVVLFIHIGFTEYFLTVHQLVDASVYFFSFDELQQTVGLSERFSVLTTVSLLLLVVAFVLTYRRLSKTKNNMTVPQNYLFLFAGCLAWMFLPLYNSQKEIAAGELGAESNVSLLFLHSSLAYLSKEEQEPPITRSSFAELDPTFTGGEMDGDTYPLFRKFDEPSTLATAMNKTSNGKAPDVVFVIVEGLSSDFVGEQAKYTGHFMPFLDSLSSVSIYYPNTLSTSQRTQNVLPSTLCSVPNVDEGTCFQQMAYPDHWSLQGLLKDQFSNGFYCGVQLEYMNMRGFMNQHSVSRLSGKWNASVTKQTEELGSPWGVPDGGLFEQYVTDRKQVKKHPSLDVLLTISTHDPFIYPEKEKYGKRVQRKLDSLKDKTFYSTLAPNAEKLGSYAYLDDMLRKMFEKLSKDKSFENTIFIVTGDHGSEMWNRSPMSKYHVPFIIYSPLLKEAKTSRDIVSHLDLTPTLSAYFTQEYNVKLPDEVPYVGEQFPIGQKAQERSFIFTTDQLKNKDVYSRHRILVDNQLYSVDDRLNLKPINNPELYEVLARQKKLYRKMSRYVLHQNQLIPPISYAQYYRELVWKTGEKFHTFIDRDFEWKSIVEVGQISPKELKSEKIKVQVSILARLPKGFYQDSLPEMVITSAPLTKMKRKKAVFRLIRPTALEMRKTGDKKRFQYGVSFDTQPLVKEKNLTKCYVYLYYKMHHSPRIIEAETVISTIK